MPPTRSSSHAAGAGPGGGWLTATSPRAASFPLHRPKAPREQKQEASSAVSGLARPPLRFPSRPRRAPWVPFTRGARGSEKLLQVASVLSREASVTAGRRQVSEPQSPSPGPGGRSLVSPPDQASAPGGRWAMSPQTAGPRSQYTVLHLECPRVGAWPGRHLSLPSVWFPRSSGRAPGGPLQDQFRESLTLLLA